VSSGATRRKVSWFARKRFLVPLALVALLPPAVFFLVVPRVVEQR